MAKGRGMRAEIAAEDVWTSRERLFDSSSTIFKATVLPSAIGATIQTIFDLGGSAVAQATGIITGLLPDRSKLEALAQLRSQLEVAGGWLTILIAEDGVEFDRWGTLPSSFPVMRAIKHHFDPNRTLNRGRFLGEL